MTEEILKQQSPPPLTTLTSISTSSSDPSSQVGVGRKGVIAASTHSNPDNTSVMNSHWGDNTGGSSSRRRSCGNDWGNGWGTGCDNGFSSNTMNRDNMKDPGGWNALYTYRKHLRHQSSQSSALENIAAGTTAVEDGEDKEEVPNRGGEDEEALSTSHVTYFQRTGFLDLRNLQDFLTHEEEDPDGDINLNERYLQTNESNSTYRNNNKPPPIFTTPGPILPKNIESPKNAIQVWYSQHYPLQTFHFNPCFTTWDNGAIAANKNHLVYYTSIFTCPVTGEQFMSGTFGKDGSYLAKYEQIKDTTESQGKGIHDISNDNKSKDEEKMDDLFYLSFQEKDHCRKPNDSQDRHDDMKKHDHEFTNTIKTNHQVLVIWHKTKKGAEHAAAARCLDSLSFREMSDILQSRRVEEQEEMKTIMHDDEPGHINVQNEDSTTIISSATTTTTKPSKVDRRSLSYNLCQEYSHKEYLRKHSNNQDIDDMEGKDDDDRMQPYYAHESSQYLKIPNSAPDKCCTTMDIIFSNHDMNKDDQDDERNDEDLSTIITTTPFLQMMDVDDDDDDDSDICENDHRFRYDYRMSRHGMSSES